MTQYLGATLKNQQDVLTVSESEPTVLWCLGAIRHLCKTSVHLVLCSKINGLTFSDSSGSSGSSSTNLKKIDGTAAICLHVSASPTPLDSVTLGHKPQSPPVQGNEEMNLELFGVVKGAVSGLDWHDIRDSEMKMN